LISVLNPSSIERFYYLFGMTSNMPSSKSEGLGALGNKVATVTQPLHH